MRRQGDGLRAVADTDIGVFRSALAECLAHVEPERVFLCNPLRPWDGGPVPPKVHDIWVCDGSQAHWILQIMVYDDDGEDIVYRRDSRVR